VRAAAADAGRDPDALTPPGPCPTAATRDDEKAAVAASAPAFDAVVAPGAWLAAEVGNMYTASVWAGLAALAERAGAPGLAGQRVLLFSYGSGAIASLFALRACGAGKPGRRFSLESLVANLDLAPRLAARARRSPADLASALAAAAAHHAGPGPAGWTPSAASIASVRPGDWYLAGVDSDARRAYARREKSKDCGGGVPASTTSSPPKVQPLAATAPSTGDLEAHIRVG
jgi:hydroxymethylglutaryl-CoA synthase